MYAENVWSLRCFQTQGNHLDAVNKIKIRLKAQHHFIGASKFVVEHNIEGNHCRCLYFSRMRWKANHFHISAYYFCRVNFTCAVQNKFCLLLVHHFLWTLGQSYSYTNHWLEEFFSEVHQIWNLFLSKQPPRIPEPKIFKWKRSLISWSHMHLFIFFFKSLYISEMKEVETFAKYNARCMLYVEYKKYFADDFSLYPTEMHFLWKFFYEKRRTKYNFDLQCHIQLNNLL